MSATLLQRARVMEAVRAIAALENQTLGDCCLFINLQPILHDLIDREARVASESQKALREIVLILDAIKGGTPSDAVFFEIGRACGTAKLAIRGDMT